MILHDPDLVVPARKVSEFICKTARDQGIDEIAALGAGREGVANLEPWVKDYLRGATTVAQILQRYCRLARVYVPYRQFWVEKDRQRVKICSRANPEIGTGDWLALSEWSQINFLLKIFRPLMSGKLTQTSIGFQTEGALTLGQQEVLQGIRVARGQSTTSLTLPDSILTAPVFKPVSGKPGINGPFSADDEPSFPDLMRELLKPCLTEDWLNINVAAEMAGCSARTFQRRLAKAGLSYSGLLDQSRVDVAKTLLDDQTTKIIDIAFEAGYEDPAHFSRSFRRVNGLTPTQYRKAHSVQANAGQSGNAGLA